MPCVTREIRKPPVHTVGTHPSLALLFVEALLKSHQSLGK